MRISRSVRFLALGLLLLVIPAVLSSSSSAQIAVGLSVRVGPPALPVYEQPICPGPGHLWTPGYWAWSDDDGYYWVPGTWVVAPVGLLWTPGYWGWGDGVYAWHAGYWGPHVGFYGGINYGFGYGGVGFVGGEWRHGAFFYNTAVMRVDSVHIKNVYVNRTVVVHNESHVAFNGGEGGISAHPSREEEAYGREKHQAALADQTRHEHEASHNRALFASENHGRPAVAATGRPGEFKGHGVVAAKAAGSPYHAPAVSPKQARVSSAGAKSNGSSHSVTPPSKSNSSSRAENNKGTNAGNHSSNQLHAVSHSESAPRTANARTQSESHASAPKASAPAPKHQSAPQEKHGKSR